MAEYRRWATQHAIGGMMSQTTPGRAGILGANGLIRPYVRRTPTLDVNPADFGRDCRGLTCKLE